MGVRSGGTSTPGGFALCVLAAILALSVAPLEGSGAHLVDTAGVGVLVSAAHAPDCECPDCQELRAEGVGATLPLVTSAPPSDEASPTGSPIGSEASEGDSSPY